MKARIYVIPELAAQIWNVSLVERLFDPESLSQVSYQITKGMSWEEIQHRWMEYQPLLKLEKEREFRTSPRIISYLLENSASDQQNRALCEQLREVQLIQAWDERAQPSLEWLLTWMPRQASLENLQAGFRFAGERAGYIRIAQRRVPIKLTGIADSSGKSFTSSESVEEGAEVLSFWLTNGEKLLLWCRKDDEVVATALLSPKNGAVEQADGITMKAIHP